MRVVGSMKKGGIAINRMRTLFDILLPVVLLFFMIIEFRYILIRIENNSLFIYDKDFLLNSLSTPGGFLGWIGQFLTQFLHFPWTGAIIWIVLAAITVKLFRMAFRGINDTLWALSYIPATILAIYSLSAGYGILLMKSPGWFFTPAIGTLIVLSTVLIYMRTTFLPVRWTIIILSASIGYILSGVWGPVSAIIAAITCCKEKNDRKDYTGLGIALISSTVLPLFLHSFYTTFRTEDIYTIGLPLINYESQWPVRLPCMLLILFMAIAPFIRISNHSSGNRNKMFFLQLSITVLSAAAVFFLSFRDHNYLIENAMSAAMDRNDWKEVTSILERTEKRVAKTEERAYSKRSKSIGVTTNINNIESIVETYSSRFYEPTRIIVLLKDVALFNLGTEAEKMFTFRDGARKQKGRYHIPISIQAGKQLYFFWGLPNYCHRWCIEESVEYGWSYSTLKYATMSAISMEEWNLARKYLSILGKTLFYRKWAATQLALVSVSDKDTIQNAVPYNTVLPLICYEDRLSNDHAMIEPFLMNHFTRHRSPQATPQFDRVAMLWAMRMQDIQIFWISFLNYLDSNSPKTIPRHYQEAALLYSNLEQDAGIQSLPFDRQVKNGYDSFVAFEKSHPVRSINESAYSFYKHFGKTFWFYYYFIRGQETF